MMRRLVFWGLLPLVTVQALRLRRRAPRLAPAAGPTQGRCGHGSPLRLLGIGDSIVAGVGAESLDQALVGRTAAALADSLQCSVEWQALGQSGIDSRGLLAKLLPRLPAYAIDVIVVSIGVNDVTALTRTAIWKRNLDALLEALSAHSPKAVIAVAGMPPLHGFPLLPQPLRALIGFRGETLERISRRVIAAHDRAVHVPVVFPTEVDRFCADGFHPSEASYAAFGAAMAEAVVSRLRAASA